MPRQTPRTGKPRRSARSSSAFSAASRSGASPPNAARSLPPVKTSPAMSAPLAQGKRRLGNIGKRHGKQPARRQKPRPGLIQAITALAILRNDRYPLGDRDGLHAMTETFWLVQSRHSLRAVCQRWNSVFARADHRRDAKLAGADRHVRIGAAELGDESADAASEDPVETGVGAGHEQNPAREALRRVADRGDRRGDAFSRNEIRLARRQMKGEHVVGRCDDRRQHEVARERVTLSAVRDALEQAPRAPNRSRCKACGSRRSSETRNPPPTDHVPRRAAGSATSASLRLRVNTNFAYSRPSMPALMNSIRLRTSMSSSCSLSNRSMWRSCSIESANRGWRGGRRPGARPVEIEIGRLVVARGQDVVGARASGGRSASRNSALGRWAKSCPMREPTVSTLAMKVGSSLRRREHPRRQTTAEAAPR